MNSFIRVQGSGGTASKAVTWLRPGTWKVRYVVSVVVECRAMAVTIEDNAANGGQQIIVGCCDEGNFSHWPSHILLQRNRGFGSKM